MGENKWEFSNFVAIRKVISGKQNVKDAIVTESTHNETSFTPISFWSQTVFCATILIQYFVLSCKHILLL